MEFPSNKTVKLWHTENEMFCLLEKNRSCNLDIWGGGGSGVGGCFQNSFSLKKNLH